MPYYAYEVILDNMPAQEVNILKVLGNVTIFRNRLE